MQLLTSFESHLLVSIVKKYILTREIQALNMYF